MAINKVEYIKDSKVPDFAVAGDEKTINKTTAKTIDEDVKEGNTADLTNAQTKYLNNALNSQDNTTYETGEGEPVPPEDGTEGPEGEEGNDKKAGETEQKGAPSPGASPAEALFGTALLQSTLAMQAILNPLTALGVGIADAAAGALGVTGAALFDNDLSSRLEEANAAGEYIATIQEYIDSLNEEMGFGNTPANEPAGPGAEGPTPTEDTPIDTDLQAKLDELWAEHERLVLAGDSEGAAKIFKEITALLNPQPADKSEETPDIATTNSEAHDIADYTANVADLLAQGDNFGNLAIMNSVALAGAAASSVILAVRSLAIAAEAATIPFIGAALAAKAVAGATLCKVGAGLFTMSSGVMAIKASQEYSCGNKGQEIASALKDLNDPLAKHDSIVASQNNQEQTPETPQIPDTPTVPSGTGDNTGGSGSSGGTGSTGGASGGTSTP